jgi:hypothetical protein
MLQPLAHRDFALLWAGMTLSLIGDGVYLVGIAWQVYALSNAPTPLAVVGLAWTLPLFLVGGLVTDRFERRRVLITADLVRLVSVGLIGVLAVTGALQLWHVRAHHHRTADRAGARGRRSSPESVQAKACCLTPRPSAPQRWRCWRSARDRSRGHALEHRSEGSCERVLATCVTDLDLEHAARLGHRDARDLRSFPGAAAVRDQDQFGEGAGDFGLVLAAGGIIWMTLLQTHVPGRLLGRVSGIDWLISTALLPLSFAVAGLLA